MTTHGRLKIFKVQTQKTHFLTVVNSANVSRIESVAVGRWVGTACFLCQWLTLNLRVLLVRYIKLTFPYSLL